MSYLIRFYLLPPLFLAALLLALALSPLNNREDEAAGAAACGPFDADGNHYVIGINSAVGLTHQDAEDGDYRSPREAGACWDRVTIHWFEAVAGNQAEHDELIHRVQQSGLNVLLVLFANYGPLTACGNYGGSSIPIDWPAWEQFVTATIERYDGDPATGAETAYELEPIRHYQIGGQMAVRAYWRDSAHCADPNAPDDAAAELAAEEFAQLVTHTRTAFDAVADPPQLGLGNIGEELMAKKFFCQDPGAGDTFHIHQLKWSPTLNVYKIRAEVDKPRAEACAGIYDVHELDHLIPLLEPGSEPLVDFIDIALYASLTDLPGRVADVRAAFNAEWESPAPTIWSTEYASPDLRFDEIFSCSLTCWERLNAADAVKRLTTGMALDLGPMFVLRYREVPRGTLPNTSPAHRHSTPLRIDGGKRASFTNLQLLGGLTNGYLQAREVAVPLPDGSVIEIQMTSRRFITALWSDTPASVQLTFAGKTRVFLYAPRTDGSLKTTPLELTVNSQNQVCLPLKALPQLIRAQSNTSGAPTITKARKVSACPS